MNLINEHRFQEDSLACRHPKRSIPMAGARWKLLLQFTIKMSHGVCKTDVTISWPGGETQHYFSTCLKRLNMQPIIVIVDSLRFFRAGITTAVSHLGLWQFPGLHTGVTKDLFLLPSRRSTDVLPAVIELRVPVSPRNQGIFTELNLNGRWLNISETVGVNDQFNG